MRIASIGQAVFAATVVVLGILSLIKGNFAPAGDKVPNAVPARGLLIYVSAFVSIASGIGLLFRRTDALAARVLLAALLLWLFLFRLPDALRALTVEGSWFGPADLAVMVAAAWVLYARSSSSWDQQRLSFATGDKGLRIARVLYGLALIPFGLAHFVYLKQTIVLVPGWLPSHVAWAYFTGSTFLAAGVAVLSGVCARLASALSALQIGLFTLLVWLPIVASPGPKNAFQ